MAFLDAVTGFGVEIRLLGWIGGILMTGRLHGKRYALTIAAIALAAIVVRIPFLGSWGFIFDQESFIFWGVLAAQKGLPAVYSQVPDSPVFERWSNYPPGYLYVLWGLAEVYPWVVGGPLDEDAGRALSNRVDSPEVRMGYSLFKAPAVLADVATAALLFVFLRRRVAYWAALWAGLIYALHPMVWHDSVVWGQVDAIHTLLLLLSVEAALRRKPVLMTVAATVALLFKAQSLMLAPLWLLALIEPGRRRSAASSGERVEGGSTVIRWASCVGIATLIFAAAMAPFGENMGGVYDSYFRAVGFYPYVHFNGFSLWFLVNPISESPLSPTHPANESFMVDHQPWLLGLTPKAVGMLLLLVVWATYLAVSWRRMRYETMLMWGARLLPLSFFLLPTQMHERYLFPVIALWGWTLGRDRAGWIGWIVVGFCSWLNIVWVFPGASGGALERWFGSNLHVGAIGQAVGVVCALSLGSVWLREIWVGVRCRRTT